MANKYYKAYKFVVGGKSRPGIVGVKPKSGGVVDEFKARKMKQVGKTQRKLESQDKAIGTEMSKARDRGATRKQLVKGRKFQRDIRRAKREGDKLRKDVLRVGKAKGGVAEKPIYKFKDEKGNFKRPKAEGKPSKINERPKAVPLKREEMKKGGIADQPMLRRDKRKPIDTRRKKRENFAPREDLKRPTPDQKGLQKLPEKVRNKMGYMKKGGRVKKFPDLSGDGKVTKKDILMGRGVIKKKNGKKKFGGGKK